MTEPLVPQAAQQGHFFLKINSKVNLAAATFLLPEKKNPTYNYYWIRTNGKNAKETSTSPVAQSGAELLLAWPGQLGRVGTLSSHPIRADSGPGH